MTDFQKKSLVVVCVLGVYVGFTAPAHAYLDPGTGSLLLQGLIASVAAVAATGSIYWGKIRAYFSKKKDPDDGRSDEQGKDNE
jgi:Na+-transporting methylmalonyl-CoA/oxaloacetate decarboxylase beta subunit